MTSMDFFEIGCTYEITILTDPRKTWGDTTFQLFWRAHKAGKPRRVSLTLQGNIDKPFVWLNGRKGTFIVKDEVLFLYVPHNKNVEEYIITEIDGEAVQVS